MKMVGIVYGTDTGYHNIADVSCVFAISVRPRAGNSTVFRAGVALQRAQGAPPHEQINTPNKQQQAHTSTYTNNTHIHTHDEQYHSKHMITHK